MRVQYLCIIAGTLFGVITAGCSSEKAAPLRRQDKLSRPSRDLLLTTKAEPGSTFEIGVYVVKKGDTLHQIAANFQNDVRGLQALNPDLMTTHIRVGQQIRVSEQINRDANFSVQSSEPEHTWLQSSSQEVVLGFCDKNGNGGFPALFIVTGPDGPDGRVHIAPPEITDQKRKTGPENYASAYVTFPSDFNTDWREGRYYWQGIVESNCVAYGAFEYHCVSNSYIVTIGP
jgi:LysM repeat protein